MRLQWCRADLRGNERDFGPRGAAGARSIHGYHGLLQLLDDRADPGRRMKWAHRRQWEAGWGRQTVVTEVSKYSPLLFFGLALLRRELVLQRCGPISPYRASMVQFRLSAGVCRWWATVKI